MSRNLETGSVGLGLSIARDVIRNHGGQIHLGDSPHGGLRVHIRLPEIIDIIEEKMTTQNITITDRAARQVAHLISLESHTSSSLFLRISVSGGGCSGFQYHFSLDDAQTPDDQMFEKNGISVVIDSISLGLLSDAIVDYVEDLTSSQFVIKNPNATASCGCGNSFSL